MDWSTLAWQLIGTIIGAIIGAYIAGRWSESGRINAVKAALAKVIEQEAAKTFAQEHARQNAIAANLDKIEKQIRTVTMAQEEIKAKISGEASHRQWKRDQALRIYNELLRAMVEYRLCLMDFTDRVRCGSAPTTDRNFKQASEAFFAAYSIAPLFLSSDSITTLNEVHRCFYYHSDFGDDLYGNHAERQAKELHDARAKLIASAMPDLHLSSVPAGN